MDDVEMREAIAQAQRAISSGKIRKQGDLKPLSIKPATEEAPRAELTDEEKRERARRKADRFFKRDYALRKAAEGREPPPMRNIRLFVTARGSRYQVHFNRKGWRRYCSSRFSSLSEAKAHRDELEEIIEMRRRTP